MYIYYDIQRFAVHTVHMYVRTYPFCITRHSEYLFGEIVPFKSVCRTCMSRIYVCMNTVMLYISMINFI